MQTVKTAIVVVLLATVVYSAWVALTAPPADLPPELAEIVESEGADGFSIDDIDIGFSDGDSSGDMMPPSIFADSSGANPANTNAAGDSTSDPASLPPTLPPSASFSNASDYTAPSMTELGITDASASSSNASARLSDIDPSRAPASNFGYEIPARTTSPDTDASKTTPGTSELADDPSFTSQQGGPGGFQLPESYSPNGTSAGPDNAATAASDPSALSSGASEVNTANRTAMANAIATADRQQQQDQLREALTTLSLFYNTPSLGEQERAAMLSRLDFLAGEVIYSQRHLLEQPYRVGAGETLQTISQTLDVPWQLLATVNQITDPAKVVPGQELKVVRGPFRAEVNLARSELTLMLGELYAGRFPISEGKDPAPKTGDYQVHDKQVARTYYALGGANIPAGDDRNPYGDVWLDLGNNMCIHGTGRAAPSSDMGCIRLSPSDARDVFSILSRGSSVTITR